MNNDNGITLMGIECSNCKINFLAKYETGEHICPECGQKNERYKIDDDLTDKEIEFIENCFKDIKTLLITNYKIKEFPNNLTLDFLVNLTKKLRG